MLRRKSALFLYVLLIVVLSACNLPSGQGNQEQPGEADLALTITAQALLLQPGSSDSQPPAGPAATATPEFTATPGPTSTPSVPQVSVTTNTNCRTGPGIVYDLIDALLIGQTAEVVGKNSSVPNYWVIKRLNGSGTCWLWGEYATVSGNTANLPEYPVPATPTPSPTPTATLTPTPSIPAPVNNPTIIKNCVLINPVPPQTFLYQGVLNWEDKSNNEDGFNIYRNGAFLGNVPANTSTYNLPPFGPFPIGVPIQYGVEAFNGAGKAAIKIVIMTCP